MERQLERPSDMRGAERVALRGLERRTTVSGNRYLYLCIWLVQLLT